MEAHLRNESANEFTRTTQDQLIRLRHTLHQNANKLHRELIFLKFMFHLFIQSFRQFPSNVNSQSGATCAYRFHCIFALFIFANHQWWLWLIVTDCLSLRIVLPPTVCEFMVTDCTLIGLYLFGLNGEGFYLFALAPVVLKQFRIYQ